ncbi:MAG TPA: hypothetical protein VFR55_01580 [Dehalococcoidia bacterium]|nr:hypothetical protein [Dehalococcoidia bacterium]
MDSQWPASTNRARRGAAQNIPPHWNTYFTVQNADQTAQKARDASGTVLMEAFDVFDAGRTAVLQDPQGAVFSVFQPIHANP